MTEQHNHKDERAENGSSLARRWLYPKEIDIIENVRWFVIVAAAATFLHVVTDFLETRRVSAFIITILRLLESFVVICDVIVFCASLFVGVQ